MPGGPRGKASPLLRGPLSRNRPFLQPAVALYEAIGVLADAATLVDAISTIVVQLSLSDTAAVADTLATLQASLALTDTALGTDALATIMAALSLTDTASVANAATLQAGLALTDTGSAIDALQTLMAGLSLADTGSVVNAVSAIQAALSLTDTAAVANAISTIQAALGTADSGTAADALTTIRAALGLSDAAVGADVISGLRAAFSVADVNFSAVVAADAPLSFWRFDENDNGDAVVRADFMGAHTLTNIGTGGVLKAGVTGQGTSLKTGGGNFAANGQARSAGDIYAFSGNAPFSAELWFWPPTGMGTSSMIAVAGGGTAWSIYTAFADGMGHPAIGFGSGHVGAGSAVFGMVMDSWNQFVVTFDGASVRYYLNGALVAGPIASSGPQVDDLVSKFSVGSLPDGGGESAMWLDELSVWGAVLTADQVAKHYSAGTSPVTATVTEAVSIAALVVKNFTDSAAVADTMTKVIEDTEYKVWHSITPVTGLGPAQTFEMWLDELQRERNKKEAERLRAWREEQERQALARYAAQARIDSYARNVAALLYYVKTGRITKRQFLAVIAKEQHKWARVS